MKASGFVYLKYSFSISKESTVFGKSKFELTVDSTFDSRGFDRRELLHLESDVVADWPSSSYDRYRCLVDHSYCRHWAWSAAKKEKLGSG